ncbi:OsmC family protein [Gulosibacter molinativorax]|uniref:Osmotically inducible protein OsmC n=1 Tax=Gulosibacter molinativorax TaxID=256821 RepID=A0ABT7C9Q2_9MICO|nr:OsmC family protein [Gulosibacter molinativorax]MDJ1371882.1 hypothetical protein [Gulosibacter molinativorax]QUY62531.1 Hypotetical protein [Gulosibacter molinativorax]
MTDSEYGPSIFTAVAENRGGANGESWIEGGLRVDVRSPIGPEQSQGTNPEELLALAWATCLSESGRIVAGPSYPVQVRTRITLHKRHDGSSFEFRGRAELHFEGKDMDAATHLAEAAHARCPVSRMLSGQSEVTIVAV